jgi:hypothetical protein
MPIPGWVARVNKRFTNRLLIRLSARPPFAALIHRGRTSGTEYRIPINVFVEGDRFCFALTYGPGTDWLANVMAAGEAKLEYRGATVSLGNPQRIGWSEAGPFVPIAVRAILRVIGVDQFLVMTRAGDAAG